MQETLIVRQHVLRRHGISPEVETKRETNLQVTYSIWAFTPRARRPTGPRLPQDGRSNVHWVVRPIPNRRG
jgi:hypothetical protein